ncbi:uncharacterized protein LOC129596080 [Paramacrobiotus metropolitanus]|uniref:uncharacterized protein LOC129596080 n=1 Tax=Paramacrobiotus metropolitanus TaxID=2943436 RepID=UPI002445E239|nr:uncharacterized protein LOC129596080 [Paramacrobiotus metropolitanus]
MDPLYRAPPRSRHGVEHGRRLPQRHQHRPGGIRPLAEEVARLAAQPDDGAGVQQRVLLLPQARVSGGEEVGGGTLLPPHLLQVPPLQQVAALDGRLQLRPLRSRWREILLSGALQILQARLHSLAIPAEILPAPLTPPSAVPSPLQHFQRFPSREDILCASPVPSLASSRYLDDDDSGEDDLDEDNVLTHNFGGTTIETGGGSASDSDDMERVIDGDAAEMEVEEWRRKRVGKMLRERGESGSNTDSSWESGEPVQNAYDDSSEPLCNAYDSSSDDSDSDADLPATVVKVPSEQRPALSPPPTRFRFDILPHSSEKPHLNDLHNVPTIFAKDYTQSRSSPLTSVRSDESDTFFTPKYSLSPQPTFPSRKPEIKWDQTVLETSRRLRELRMTGRDTPSRTGCESADDVFHTPRTSFHERDAEYRPGTSESKVSEGSDGGSRNYGNNLVPLGSGRIR